jgi:hypothetical protein
MPFSVNDGFSGEKYLNVDGILGMIAPEQVDQSFNCCSHYLKVVHIVMRKGYETNGISWPGGICILITRISP